MNGGEGVANARRRNIARDPGPFRGAGMRVRVGVRHNLVGQAGFRPDGDQTALARQVRPNACEAAALFVSDWQDHVLDVPADGVLSVTVMLDHAGMKAPSNRLVRMRDGWAAVLHLCPEKLAAGGRELPIGTIADALDIQMRDALAQVRALGGPGKSGDDRSDARR